MATLPPLIALYVVELAFPEAATTTGRPTDAPLLLVGKLVPGTLSAPPAAWPFEFVPTSPFFASPSPLPPQLYPPLNAT
ncbi:hypothetical protein D3C86_1226630 [compost metagenome]